MEATTKICLSNKFLIRKHLECVYSDPVLSLDEGKIELNLVYRFNKGLIVSKCDVLPVRAGNYIYHLN